MKIKIPYAPQPHQKALHDTKGSLIAVTGRQIGKTTCVVNELIKRAILLPKSRNWYITNDYQQARRNVWQLLKDYCPPELLLKKPNETMLKVELLTGSVIELIGVENAEKLRGASVHFMGLDEYADFKRGIFEKVLEPMLSTTGGDVWFLGTPKGLGNDFYQKYVQDNRLKKFKYPSCRVNGVEVIKILSKYTNEEKLQEVYKDALDNGKLDWFNQEYLAEFTRPYGTVYKEWNIDNFVKLDYDENLPLHLALDFGVNDPTAIIWIQPNGGETRVIDYYEASNADINHFIQVIKSKPYKSPEFCAGDIAGNARDLTTNKSPIGIMREAGLYVKTTSIKSIPLQIRHAHSRVKNLYISEKAERFRDVILNYRYPEINSNLRNQSNEIPLHDEWSHGARAWEYWCWNYQPPDQVITKPKKKNSGQDLLDSIEAKRKAKEYLSWL